MPTLRNAGLVLLSLVASGVGLARASETPTLEGPQGPAEKQATAQAQETAPSAELAIESDVAGEILIRDREGRVVVRVLKELGRPAIVRLAPGRYDLEWAAEGSSATIVLTPGDRVLMDRARLTGKERPHILPPLRQPEPRHAAGSDSDPRSWRVTFDSGFWLAPDSSKTLVVITDDGFRSQGGGLLGGMSFGYRMRPELMLTFVTSSRVVEAVDSWGDGHGHSDRVSMISTFSVGARVYLPPLASRSAVKPYLSAGVGPSLGSEIEDRHDDGRRHGRGRVRTTAVFGGFVGAGIDLQPTSWLVLGGDVTYHLAPEFSAAVGGYQDPSGFAVSFQIGTTFGRRLAGK